MAKTEPGKTEPGCVSPGKGKRQEARGKRQSRAVPARNSATQHPAGLSTQHGSVTTAQIKRLHQLGIPRGFTHEDLRALAEVESLKDLSSAAASDLIRQLGGGELKHAPGQAPAPSRAKGRTRGTIRLITEAQLQQIERLGKEVFTGANGGNGESSPVSVLSVPSCSDVFMAWLKKDFKVETIRDLATAERGGQVIAVLKEMLARRGRTASLRPSVPSSLSCGVCP